jgi:putative oxidoreductase
MDMFIKLGRYLLAIPLAIFGVLNLINAAHMVGMVPSWIPGGVIWVYLIGLFLIAGAVSILMGKKGRLAGTLIAILMIIFVLTIYLPKVMNGDDTSMSGLLKDLMIAGGALVFASTQPHDE